MDIKELEKSIEKLIEQKGPKETAKRLSEYVDSSVKLGISKYKDYLSQFDIDNKLMKGVEL